MSDDSGFGFVASGAEGGSSFLVSNGSLLPFLEAKKARNRRYMLLRELSRAVWSGTLPAHGVRYCSRKAIPAETQKKDGTWVPTGMPGHIEVQSRDEGTRHSYHGLGRCASPLVCPFCSAVIQAHRCRGYAGRSVYVGSRLSGCNGNTYSQPQPDYFAGRFCCTVPSGTARYAYASAV